MSAIPQLVIELGDDLPTIEQLTRYEERSTKNKIRWKKRAAEFNANRRTDQNTIKRNREHSRAWAARNPTRVLETRRAWRAKNWERDREKNRERDRARYAREAERRCRAATRWRRLNVDRKKKLDSEYRAKNPERVRKKIRRWYLANTELLREQRRKRYAQNRSAILAKLREPEQREKATRRLRRYATIDYQIDRILRRAEQLQSDLTAIGS